MMTNEQFIDAWRTGKAVRVISMGGMGDGYERCIWDGAVTMLADLLERKPQITKGEPLTQLERDALDKALHKSPSIDAMSGAQAGAAKNAALVFYCNGYEAGLAMAPKGRVIELTPSA
jgi:hypothetical protein